MTSPGSGAQAEAAVLERDFDAPALPLLREQVMACATAAGLPAPRCIDVILAVHELAANAVSHGPATGRLRVHAAQGTLRCQVSDAGSGAGPWPVRDGHGLWLVRQVANQMTVTYGPNRSEVTVVFTRHPPHEAAPLQAGGQD